MPLFRHEGMKVIRFFPKAASFLKQYTTNLPEAPLSAFLTREGKTVAWVRQAKISDEEVWVVAGKAFVERLQSHLSKYLALAETRMDCLSDVSVYFEDSNFVKTDDPVIPEKSGRWILSRRLLSAAWTAGEYTRFRVEHAIPEQGADFDQEMPLCIDASSVSFEKGCYLGQEIVARVHYRGVPPKKLVVKRRSECSEEQWKAATSKTVVGSEPAGFVFV